MRSFAERIKKLNGVARHEMSLLDRPVMDVAKALKIPAESTSPGLLSWRLYASRVLGQSKEPCLLFGAMPYSLAMYGSPDNKVSQIPAVYANKGDFGSTVGSG